MCLAFTAVLQLFHPAKRKTLGTMHFFFLFVENLMEWDFDLVNLVLFFLQRRVFGKSLLLTRCCF